MAGQLLYVVSMLMVLAVLSVDLSHGMGLFNLLFNKGGNCQNGSAGAGVTGGWNLIQPGDPYMDIVVNASLTYMYQKGILKRNCSQPLVPQLPQVQIVAGRNYNISMPVWRSCSFDDYGRNCFIIVYVPPVLFPTATVTSSTCT